MLELEKLTNAIIAPRSGPRKVALLLLAVGLAAGLRYLVDRGETGFPFLTFIPAILLSAIFLGAEYAAMAAILSLVIARTLFGAPVVVTSAEPARGVLLLLLFAGTMALIVITGQLLRSLVLEGERHLRQQEAFNAELQHRTKNALQIFRALIARGPRGEDPQSYFASLGGRLDALAKSNEMLRFGVLEAAPVRDLVTSAIAPFDRARITLSGPDCRIDRSAATPLMMALHELCTNATKYGALSCDSGQVSIAWEEMADRPQGAVVLTWRESGGPMVSPPTHRGLGSRLLVANGGLTKVNLDWQPAGVICTLHARGCADAAPAAGRRERGRR